MEYTAIPLSAYQLEEDKTLIEKIMNHELTQKLLNWTREQSVDEVYNTVYRASYLKANDTIAPKLMAGLRKACALVGLEQVPDVYLVRDFDDTITIGGITNPFLLLSSRYLEVLEAEGEQVLLGVLTGQMAGIMAGHHRGLLLSWLLSTASGLLGLNRVMMVSLEGLLNDWKRCRIYTCDRAMYLAMQDYPLAMRTILGGTIPAGILDNMGPGTDQDAYQAQVEAFRNNSQMDEFINFANSVFSDTSWLPLRCHKLTEFVQEVKSGGGK